jgi:hypothetical protein
VAGVVAAARRAMVRSAKASAARRERARIAGLLGQRAQQQRAAVCIERVKAAFSRWRQAAGARARALAAIAAAAHRRASSAEYMVVVRRLMRECRCFQLLLDSKDVDLAALRQDAADAAARYRRERRSKARHLKRAGQAQACVNAELDVELANRASLVHQLFDWKAAHLKSCSTIECLQGFLVWLDAALVRCELCCAPLPATWIRNRCSGIAP